MRGTGRAIAEPACRHLDVRSLRHRELGGRVVDVPPERLGVERDGERLDEFPPAVDQEVSVRRVGRVEIPQEAFLAVLKVGTE